MSRYPIEFNSPESVLDYLEVDACGILRIHGWYHDFGATGSVRPQLSLNGRGVIEPFAVFRVQRADVKEALGSEANFHGVVFEYSCLESAVDGEKLAFEVYWKGQLIASGADATPIQPPDYPYLLNDERIFHRDWIYCSGLPVDYLNPEVLFLAKTLEGPILDLGCGTGGLVEALRIRGMDARGLELDRQGIRGSLPERRKDFVDLYTGSLPLPYGDKSFESVIMSEVLEHVAEPETLLSEVDRICRGNCLVTVPDMSGVPLNHKNGLVPWHLLESTHVNFFNPRSLEAFLKNWFPRVSLYRIGPTVTNDTQWWGGLMALARK